MAKINAYLSEKRVNHPSASNFERPFAPRTSLRSPRNFGSTHFGRFATFDFLTPKIFFQIFFGFFGFGHRFFVIFHRFWRIWAFLDVKIKLLDGFCFRFVILSGLYDIWSPFSRPKTKMTLINPPTSPRPQATGRGRGGVNPPQDWGLVD